MSIFTNTQRKKIPFSFHNLSHSSLMSLQPGFLYVANFEELMPSSKISYANGFRLMSDAFFAPAFQDMKFIMRDFAVPHRVLFPKFPEYIAMITKRSDNSPLSPYEPYTTIEQLVNHQNGNLTQTMIADMFRIPPVDKTLLSTSTTDIKKKKIRLLPLLGFLKIYADWFADENYSLDVQSLLDYIAENNMVYIQNTDTATVYQADGSTQTRNILLFLFDELQYFAFLPKNYFTAVLPFQQKGPVVSLPGVSGVHNVKFVGNSAFSNASNRLQVIQGSTPGNESSDFGVVSPYNGTAVTSAGHLVVEFDEESSDIVQLRNRLALQQFFERNATGGTRFVEFLRAHYGSHLPDPLAQRSIYLRGTAFNFGAEPIYSTAESFDQSQPSSFVGDVSGKVNVADGQSTVGYTAKEHCFHFTLCYILIPPTIGAQGLPRIMTRMDPLEYALPEFSDVGEQPIYSEEYILSPFSENEHVAGYAPRYADFKSHQNEIHGQFRNTYDFWHATKFLDYTNNSQMNTYANYEPNGNHMSGWSNHFSDPDKMFAVAEKLGDPFKLWFYTRYELGLPVSKYGTPKSLV